MQLSVELGIYLSVHSRLVQLAKDSTWRKLHVIYTAKGIWKISILIQIGI